MIANNDNVHVTQIMSLQLCIAAQLTATTVSSGQEAPLLQQGLGLADDVPNIRARLGIAVQAELHQHVQLFCMPVVRRPPQLVAATTNITLLSTKLHM